MFFGNFVDTDIATIFIEPLSVWTKLLNTKIGLAEIENKLQGKWGSIEANKYYKYAI